MPHLNESIATAVQVLVSGGLVAIPTETVYGLAANALDPVAVAKIFAAKGRPNFDPLIVHCRDIVSAKGLTREWAPGAEALARAFWPGPLTLVLPRLPLVPDIVTSGLDTVGVRVPAHPITLELLSRVEFPLAAPSANPFGYVSPTTAQHVCDSLGSKVDYVMDGGPCPVGVESTIVGFAGGSPTVLRLGGIPLEALESVLGQPVTRQLSSSKPSAPGQLLSHYAPRVPIYLIDDWSEIPDGQVDYGLIGYSALPNAYAGFGTVLAPDGSDVTAAQRLFAALREAEIWGVKVVFAQRAPLNGLGLAINDRLTRAAVR